MMNGSKAVFDASSIGSLVNGTKFTSLSTTTFISPGTTNACAVEMRRDVNTIFIAMVSVGCMEEDGRLLCRFECFLKDLF